MQPHSLHFRSFLPTIYVHAPEEDNLPPLCCFGDEQELEPAEQPVIDEDSDNEDYGHDITIRAGDYPAEDLSEVVEVIKVRRISESRNSEQPALKHSDTFISRAFRSIKNVNITAASRSKKAETVSSPQTTPRPRRFSRRSSVNLTQLFNPSPQKSSTRSSFDSTSSSVSGPRPLRRSVVRRDSIDTESVQLSTRSPSPTPSTQTFPIKRRMSVLNLFSRTSSTPVIAKMTSIESLSQSSGSSFAGPVTPTESITPAAVPFNPATPFEHPAFCTPEAAPPILPPKGATLLKRLPSFIKKGGVKEERKKAQGILQVAANDDPAGDISFEMRLDSLHFDELSFDVDRF